MTKKEIIKAIADKLDRPQVLVREVVIEAFDLIIESLVQDGRIELRNFGVFEVRLRKERRARNPKTGEDVTVAAKKVVGFQPGKVMEERARHAKKVIEVRQKKVVRKRAEAPTPVPPVAKPELVPAGGVGEPEA